MAPEPVEVEVLDKDGAPLVQPEKKKLSLLNPIHALAFIFAFLTAMMIVLIGVAGVLMEQARKLDEELPPDEE